MAKVIPLYHYRHDPVDMHGQGKTWEHDWQACSRRCARVHGCAHFSFWPDKGCHLQHGWASRILDWNVITGPPPKVICRTIHIWDLHGNIYDGPRDDFSTWGRAAGHSQKISFGFQFIQFGHFRLGAADDTHLSLSHSNGYTMQIFKDNGWVTGHRRRRGQEKDHGTWDRPVGAPLGISYGDRFIQLGNFRLGQEDGERFVVSHVKSKRSIRIFNGREGKVHTDQGHLHTHFLGREPAAWTCKDIAESAFGPCDPEFGSWGDRFIQLGNWRMGAFDDFHFTFSHKNGQTAEILIASGFAYPSNPSDNFGLWGRPLGYPSGIVFGDRFIQFGNWRVAAYDDTHLSFSHRDGKTAKVFRTSSFQNGPMVDFNAWHKNVGPPSGVTFGDRFLQIGNFRIGDFDGNNLAVSYGDHGLYGFAVKGTSAWGGVPPHWWGHTMNSRYAHWHCGSIQEVMGTCTGIVTGPDFLQIGDWRLAAENSNTFTVAHIGGQVVNFVAPSLLQTNASAAAVDCTNANSKYEPVDMPGQGRVDVARWQDCQYRCAQVIGCRHFSFWSDGGCHFQDGSAYLTADNGVVSGPPHCQVASGSVWDREAKATEQRVLFGDRFVQIGAFRLGAVDGTHFSISHRNGATMVIYRSNYATDPFPVHPGVRWDYGLWGRGHASKNPALSPMGITFGDRFVQIGNFRLGEVDKEHFSVAHAGTGKTLQVFNSKGHHFRGPRDDFTTLGRSLEQCKEMEP